MDVRFILPAALLVAALLLLWVISFPRSSIVMISAALYITQATSLIPQDEIYSKARALLPQDFLDGLLSDKMLVIFIALFTFRYFRLIVHILAFWALAELSPCSHP